MSKEEILLAIGSGLMVNEFCDLSPWAARKIIAWSAHLRYGRCRRAEIRAEELTAVIDSRPGKLLKLTTALAFACGATTVRARQIMHLAQLYLYVVGHEPTSTTLGSGVTVTYISTDITAHQVPLTDSTLEERINIILATNTISTGVDLGRLDHITVITNRPIAPMDNLTQLSGRANRCFND